MTPLLCGCIVIWKGTARSIEGPRLPWALHTPVWYVGLACPCLVFQQESHACVVCSTPCDVRVADATAVLQFFFYVCLCVLLCFVLSGRLYMHTCGPPCGQLAEFFVRFIGRNQKEHVGLVSPFPSSARWSYQAGDACGKTAAAGTSNSKMSVSPSNPSSLTLSSPSPRSPYGLLDFVTKGQHEHY